MRTPPLASLILSVALAGCGRDSAAYSLDAEADADASTVDDAGAPDAPQTPDAGVVGSAGCGTAASSGVTTRTIQIGTRMRSYVVSIPTGYDPDRPLPLVFGWHGQGGTGPRFQAGTAGWGGGVEDAADGSAIFIYPTGLVKDSVMKTGWYVGTGPDLDLFDTLVETIAAELCIDTSRIFSFGYSYGARMTNELGCLRPDVLRAIAPISGYGPIGPCMGGAVPVWMHNAQNDQVVPVARGVAARDHWRTANSCASTAPTAIAPAPCVAYQGCDAPLHWCSPPTGGHTFPAYVYAGIWSFFEAQ